MVMSLRLVRALRAAATAPAANANASIARATRWPLAPLQPQRSIVTTAHTNNNASSANDATANVHAHIHARLDYKKLAANVDAAVANARKRFSDADPALVVALYHDHTKLQLQVNALRAERNAIAKQLGLAKAQSKTKAADSSDSAAAIDVDAMRDRGQSLKREIAAMDTALAVVQQRLEVESLKLPNDTHPDVPVGDEDASKIVHVGGSPRAFDFAPLDHYDIATRLQLIDSHAASTVSGSKFVYLTNEAAMLELALVHWTMSKLRARGFTIVLPPDVAHYKMVEGCGFQPRGTGADASQIYGIENSDLCLAATAEITLTASKSNAILDSATLPLKLAGFSHCFRTEIGHGGRQTRGIYRVHQFSKVEMVGFTTDDATQSQTFMDEMLALQQEICSELGLHYNVVDMATGDLGAPAYRKLDVLAWMPGRDAFGEIASLSMCTDYQARRLNIRHRSRKDDPTAFVHTLNGTACAVPRLLIAILETNQQQDGSVVIPEVLRPYLGGQCVIAPRD